MKSVIVKVEKEMFNKIDHIIILTILGSGKLAENKNIYIHLK